MGYSNASLSLSRYVDIAMKGILEGCPLRVANQLMFQPFDIRETSASKELEGVLSQPPNGRIDHKPLSPGQVTCFPQRTWGKSETRFAFLCESLPPPDYQELIICPGTNRLLLSRLHVLVVDMPVCFACCPRQPTLTIDTVGRGSNEKNSTHTHVQLRSKQTSSVIGRGAQKRG